MLRSCRYGRILSRIKDDQHASKILQWVACAKTTLTEPQFLQALLIRPSMSGFVRQNKAYLDIRRKCGPVIELENGKVRFVHFTVYE